MSHTFSLFKKNKNKRKEILNQAKIDKKKRKMFKFKYTITDGEM